MKQLTINKGSAVGQLIYGIGAILLVAILLFVQYYRPDIIISILLCMFLLIDLVFLASETLPRIKISINNTHLNINEGAGLFNSKYCILTDQIKGIKHHFHRFTDSESNVKTRPSAHKMAFDNSAPKDTKYTITFYCYDRGKVEIGRYMDIEMLKKLITFLKKELPNVAVK